MTSLMKIRQMVQSHGGTHTHEHNTLYSYFLRNWHQCSCFPECPGAAESLGPSTWLHLTPNGNAKHIKCVHMSVINDFIIWSSSVALQPRSGLGLPCWFHDSYSTMWVISSTIDLVLHTLIQPSETSSSNYQRLLWRSRETRVRNGRWILPTSTYRARRVLLHAVNLRHGKDGFTSPPKKGVLRILSPLKSIVLGRVWNREPWVQWQAR
jgi:hypothetical protein